LNKNVEEKKTEEGEGIKQQDNINAEKNQKQREGQQHLSLSAQA
jgi:hypothetical protein